MNVADNGDRGLDVHDIALLHQQLFRLGADGLDDRVGEELFAVEAGDALIEIDTGWGKCQYAVLGGVARDSIPGRPGIADTPGDQEMIRIMSAMTATSP